MERSAEKILVGVAGFVSKSSLVNFVLAKAEEQVRTKYKPKIVKILGNVVFEYIGLLS